MLMMLPLPALSIRLPASWHIRKRPDHQALQRHHHILDGDFFRLASAAGPAILASTSIRPYSRSRVGEYGANLVQIENVAEHGHRPPARYLRPRRDPLQPGVIDVDQEQVGSCLGKGGGHHTSKATRRARDQSNRPFRSNRERVHPTKYLPSSAIFVNLCTRTTQSLASGRFR